MVILDPAEFLYYLGYKVKTAYDLRRQRRLPTRVISIGNMTTGGTGKTPATVSLALEAKARGLNPCVLTRGYKGSLKGPCLITANMDPSEAGDEPILIAGKLGGVPVIKGADRYSAGKYALEKLMPKPDLFILDDGFQHRRLYRDLDVVLVNSAISLRNHKLLPSGRLREPLDGLQRADAIVLTNASPGSEKETTDLLSNHDCNAPIFEAEHKPIYLASASGDLLPLRMLAGKPVYAFSGIAYPTGFYNDLEEAGAVMVGRRSFRDHHTFSPSDIEAVRAHANEAGAEWIITTEKDIIRLKRERLPDNLFALAIELSISKAFYDYVFKQAHPGKPE